MSDITIWRNTDPEDGTWTLGRFTGPTDDGDGRHAIWTIDEGGMRRIHALLGDVLNIAGQDQDVYAADNESEAVPPTPEEEAQQKVWDAIAIGQRMEALFLARKRYEIAIHEPLTGQRTTPAELEDKPIYHAIQRELDELDERLRAL